MFLKAPREKKKKKKRKNSLVLYQYWTLHLKMTMMDMKMKMIVLIWKAAMLVYRVRQQLYMPTYLFDFCIIFCYVVLICEL